MTFVRPTFQPQNPALNGYMLGWNSCTAYSGAMAASFDRQVPLLVTGEQVRKRTGDIVGGLTLAQVDASLNTGWGVNLDTVYRLPWADFAKKIDAGCGAILQGWYAPIADSRFDAGRGFRGNHAVFVPPDWAAMDPLADGRYGEAYRFHAEPYPQQLLRTFAGLLDLGNGSRLGTGFVYASFTRDNVHTYRLAFTPGAFWVYRLGPDGRIAGRKAVSFSKATSASCSGPASYSWPGHGSRTLVKVTAGLLKGQFVQVPQGNVKLEVVP